MQIYTSGTEPYRVQEEDVLWLLRAVEAEGPLETEVAATLINGFCFTRSKGQYSRLVDFVRAYAQPVNPRWYVSGDLFLKSLGKLRPAEQERAYASALRRERVHSTRFQFSKVTERAVVAALSGLVAIPPNATDYAAAYVDAYHKNYTPLAAPVASRNRLWSRSGAALWAGYRVTPEEVKPWLLSLNQVKLERAWDRELAGELSKIAQFFQENDAAYNNRLRQISLGKIRVDVGETNQYSKVYTVSLLEQAVNGRVASWARAQEMVTPRAAFFESQKYFNAAQADQWARQTANLVRMASVAADPPVVVKAMGFDFTTGKWVTV